MDAIKEAIEKLPPEQQTVLANWLSERDWKSWDEQIERDFSSGGRGMPLLAELEREIAGPAANGADAADDAGDVVVANDDEGAGERGLDVDAVVGEETG